MLSVNSYSQHLNILISNSNSPEEPSIIINPNNTSQLVAGANINNNYYSNDGGLTWTSGMMNSQYVVWGDPCVIVDTAGSFYFFHLSFPDYTDFIDRIVCQKSTDGGVTWEDSGFMGYNGGKGQDKEWATVDRSNNNIYVTWSQFDNYGSSNSNDSSIIRFSKSVDGGESWSEAVRLSKQAGDCIDSDETDEGAVPAVGPNGEVYVTWAGPDGLVFDRSYDQGETWLDDDIFICEIPGGWDYSVPGISRCNGLPVTCCDTSEGPFTGNVYVNWTDQRNGEDDTDVWFVKSSDNGDNWTAPIRVNDDLPGKHQFFTWMTIDQVTGYIWFVFYDRRNYEDEMTDVYCAVSHDGGNTFVNFKISESPFFPFTSVFFGDYTNITAHNNVVRPIWTRLDNTLISVWTSIIDVNIIGIDDAEKSEINLSNYPNPFDEKTYISFKLHHGSVISLDVFDICGRKVADLIDNEFYTMGKHVFGFNASEYNLKQGIYMYSLRTDKKEIVKLMVLGN